MWIIVHPFTSFARVEFVSQPKGDVKTYEYDDAVHVAYNMRCAAFNPPRRKCAFCGGPTPCLRDD